MSVAPLPKHTSPRRLARALSWTLRILAAAAFLAAGIAKLTGLPMMVAVFDQIGLGQWFRIVTGVIEVAGAVALLLPGLFALSAAALAAMMLAATGVHLFVIGGSPVPAIVLMLVTATVAWMHRSNAMALLRRTQP